MSNIKVTLPALLAYYFARRSTARSLKSVQLSPNHNGFRSELVSLQNTPILFLTNKHSLGRTALEIEARYLPERHSTSRTRSGFSALYNVCHASLKPIYTQAGFCKKKATALLNSKLKLAQIQTSNSTLVSEPKHYISVLRYRRSHLPTALSYASFHSLYDFSPPSSLALLSALSLLSSLLSSCS